MRSRALCILFAGAVIAAPAACGPAPAPTTEVAAKAGRSAPPAPPQSATEAAKPPPAVPSPKPAFDYVGTWIDDPDCAATDMFMRLDRDGQVRVFGQPGRWSVVGKALRFDLEAVPAAEGSDAQEAWSGRLPVEIKGPDAIEIAMPSGKRVIYHRCAG